MIKGNFPLERFEGLNTPFYYYDMELLNNTLDTVDRMAGVLGYHIHYAIKANANPRILNAIKQKGFGVDCVSGGEIEAALNEGYDPSKIVFAGVGKADWEIELALKAGIFCFNVESEPEMVVIDEIAGRFGKQAKIALRVNPDVKANTHAYITTGKKENKFGVNLDKLNESVALAQSLKHIELIGLHFHIGSQITDMCDFQHLCIRINAIQEDLEAQGISLQHINVGGGLGINYQHPNHVPMADFESYFKVFSNYLELREGQTLHFELGRSIVAQCGSMITRVLYVKDGATTQFAIVDAGMTDLIRPALYKAYHYIENLSSNETPKMYDIVGPICESSDTFAKGYLMNAAKRGDILAMRSAGAYGEIMASRYNLRTLPLSYFSDELNK